MLYILEMSIDPLYVAYVLGGLLLILIGWIVRLEIKIRKLLSGKDGKSLEDSIVSYKKEVDKLSQFQKEASLYFLNIEKRFIAAISEGLAYAQYEGTPCRIKRKTG